jgi:hypothetical protein
MTKKTMLPLRNNHDTAEMREAITLFDEEKLVVTRSSVHHLKCGPFKLLAEHWQDSRRQRARRSQQGPQCAEVYDTRSSRRIPCQDFLTTRKALADLSHPPHFSRVKMQLEVGVLMRRVSYDESGSTSSGLEIAE